MSVTQSLFTPPFFDARDGSQRRGRVGSAGAGTARRGRRGSKRAMAAFNPIRERRGRWVRTFR